MKLSDITPLQILGGVLVVNTVLVGGTTQLTDLFGAAMANHILSVCILGSGICGGFIMQMGGMGSQVRNVLGMTGVEKIDINGQANAALAKLAVDPTLDKIAPTAAAMATVTATAKAAAVLLFALILGALVLPGDAQAKSCVDPLNKLPIGCTPRPTSQSGSSQSDATALLASVMSAVSKPFKDLADFIASDPTGAATLATQIPNLQDTNGKACWTKMQNAGAVFQAHPVPLTLKVMTDFESLRLLQMTANDLCSYTPCTVVFSDGANLATAVASAVGGALTSNAVPSLTQLCARIPQLSPMLPQAVTGIAPTAVAATTPATAISTPAAAPVVTPAPASAATPDLTK